MVKLRIDFDVENPTAECPRDTVELMISNRNADRLTKAIQLMRRVGNRLKVNFNLLDDDRPKSRRQHR